MNLQERIQLLTELGDYILADGEAWQEAKAKAGYENGWFIPAFTRQASEAIARSFLRKEKLEAWVAAYPAPATSRQVGIVMAGNIPLVGFHDWLCVFISGHRPLVKLSARDQVLLRHLTDQLGQWSPTAGAFTQYAERLNGCDAYIATGSNNSSRYFDYYFGKYPHIIRRNRTSVAVLSGRETGEELSLLADDVYSYFGLGCRNVTKLYVPEGYDFVPLLETFRKYQHLADHHKYKNNYDYNLALHILNNKYYMTNGSLLLVEEPGLFSPISQLHYSYYQDPAALAANLAANEELQCIVGKGYTEWGQGQSPALNDYADGVDTMDFLSKL